MTIPEGMHLCSGAGEKVFVVLYGFLHVVLLKHRIGVVEHVCDARYGLVVLPVTLGLQPEEQEAAGL